VPEGSQEGSWTRNGTSAKRGVWLCLLSAFDASFSAFPAFDIICCVMARLLDFVPKAASLVAQFDNARICALFDLLLASPERPSHYIVNLLCNLYADRPDWPVDSPPALSILHALRVRPLVPVNFVFIKHFAVQSVATCGEATREFRAFVREIVDLCREFSDSERMLHLALAVVFRLIHDHRGLIAAIAKRSLHSATLCALAGHPNADIAVLAIGTVCQFLDECDALEGSIGLNDASSPQKPVKK
jgi:hypothetical protein